MQNAYEDLNGDLQFQDMSFEYVATSVLKSLSDSSVVAPIKLNQMSLSNKTFVSLVKLWSSFKIPWQQDYFMQAWTQHVLVKPFSSTKVDFRSSAENSPYKLEGYFAWCLNWQYVVNK